MQVIYSTIQNIHIALWIEKRRICKIVDFLLRLPVKSPSIVQRCRSTVILSREQVSLFFCQRKADIKVQFLRIHFFAVVSLFYSHCDMSDIQHLNDQMFEMSVKSFSKYRLPPAFVQLQKLQSKKTPVHEKKQNLKRQTIKNLANMCLPCRCFLPTRVTRVIPFPRLPDHAVHFLFS